MSAEESAGVAPLEQSIGRLLLRRRLSGKMSRLARSKATPGEFTDFFEDKAEAILAYLIWAGCKEQDALDLMAETFTIAFAKRRDFRGKSEEEAIAWIRQIANSLLKKFWRTKAIELKALKRAGFEQPIASEDELRELELVTVTSDISTHLEAALNYLPAEQQEVLRLRYVQNLTYVEIGDALGISEDAARKRRERAMQMLRKNPHIREIELLMQT